MPATLQLVAAIPAGSEDHWRSLVVELGPTTSPGGEAEVAAAVEEFEAALSSGAAEALEAGITAEEWADLELGEKAQARANLARSRPISPDMPRSRPISNHAMPSHPISPDLAQSRPICPGLASSQTISCHLARSRPISAGAARAAVALRAPLRARGTRRGRGLDRRALPVGGGGAGRAARARRAVAAQRHARRGGGGALAAAEPRAAARAAPGADLARSRHISPGGAEVARPRLTSRVISPDLARSRLAELPWWCCGRWRARRRCCPRPRAPAGSTRRRRSGVSGCSCRATAPLWRPPTDRTSTL